jgi:hypothetical protein
MTQSAQSIDKNGFRKIEGCPVSSFGIFDYSAAQVQVPGWESDPNRIVKIFRPEDEVRSPEFLQSFDNKPFIINHTNMHGEDADEGEDPDDVGVKGVLTNMRYEAPWARGDIHVFSRKAQMAIDRGMKDVSLGYDCTFDMTPGVFNGQPYEAVQRNLRGNHIALVPEGRVKGARVLDGRCFDHLSFELVRPSDKEKIMANAAQVAANRTAQAKRAKIGDNSAAALKSKLAEIMPILQQFMGEEAGEPAHQDAGASAEAPGAATATPPVTGHEHVDAAGGEGDPASSGEGGTDIAGLISEIEGVLAQLKAASGGEANGSAAQAGDEDPGTGETVAGETGDALQSSAREANAEGCQIADEGNVGAIGAGQGKASPGPSAGTHTQAGDSSLAAFYRDSARKNRLYDRLSKVVGAFDAATMDASGVARYGVATLKKRGVVMDCAPGTEHVTLEAYLTGVEAAAKANHAAAVTRNTSVKTGDAAVEDTEVSAYLKGKK